MRTLWTIILVFWFVFIFEAEFETFGREESKC